MTSFLALEVRHDGATGDPTAALPAPTAAAAGDDAGHSAARRRTDEQPESAGAAGTANGSGAADLPATISPSCADVGDGPTRPAKAAWRLTAARVGRRARVFGKAHFMPLSFLAAAALALAWPVPGEWVGSWTINGVSVVQAANNAIVFLISGLTLRSEDLGACLRCWLGLTYGLIAILVITPCLAFGLVAIPLQPPEFAVGLAVFAVVPTTLGVGVALTSESKGNTALALALTVITNLLGIVTVPYTLRLVLSTSSSEVLSVNPDSLVVKLVFTVLIPTVVGKAARDLIAHVRTFVTRHKEALSMFSTFNLALIVWQVLSAAREQLLEQSAGAVFAVLGLALAMHLAYLAFNALAVSRWLLRLPLPEAVAVLIMGSQKSAPVAVAVINFLSADAAVRGLMALPCILGQLLQIFVGAFMARGLRALAPAEREE